MIAWFAFMTIFLAAIAWIVVDREFDTVPSWMLTIREPWNRSSQFGVYGTRAVAFAVCVIVQISIGAHLVLRSPTLLPKIAATAFVIAAFVLLAISIPVAARLHRRAYIASLVRRIQEQIDVHNFFDTAELTALDYTCAGDWTAWQVDRPTCLAPVSLAYVNTDRNCIVFGGDLQSFLCWQPSDRFHAGDMLPFDGPLESKFRIERIDRFACLPNWISINCRMESINPAAKIRGTMS